MKANSIVSEQKSYLITADTIVTVVKRLLMKTSDQKRAKEYLNLLSGRRHSVYTAFCVKHSGSINFKLVKTVLKMRLLTKKKLCHILQVESGLVVLEVTASKGEQSVFPFISGCYSNVVGLPLPSLIGVLAMGFYKKK